MKTKALLFLIFAMSVLLYAQFGHIIEHPNTIYLGTSLDGYKNYWTPTWHVLYDSTYHRFSGINYPYQEHVTFTDNQPLISNLVRFWSLHFFDVSHLMIAVLNLCMIGSILIASIFIFLLLKKFRLPDWYAVLGSIGIAFLSPQVMRMSGHYALAYSCVIPIFLYLLFNFQQQQRLIKSIYVGLFLVVIAQIHLYYFGISIFFLIFYFLIKGIQEIYPFDKNLNLNHFIKVFKINGLHFFVQAILPYIFINFWWLKIDNNITDRPSAPNGFLYYKAYLEGIFTSPDAFYYNFVDRFIVTIPKVKDPEGVVYIGVVAAAFSLVLLIRLLTKKTFFIEDNSTEKSATTAWKPVFWVAFILMLLSIGFPFVFKPLEPLLDYTGPLKQFRGIGRFAWVYFYVANIAALYFFYTWATQKGGNWQRIVPILTIALLLQEAYMYQSQHATFETRTAEDIWSSCGEPIEKVLPFFDPKIYQAAFPIPYFNVGSENYHIDPQGLTFQYCSFPALKTGLPTMGNFLSRTSLQQAYNGVQLCLSPYGKLEIIKDLDSKKPILLVQNKSADTTFQCTHLIQKATFLYENKAIKLYALSMDSLRSLTLDNPSKKLLDTTQCAVYQSFDNQKSSKIFSGSGAFEQIMSDKTIVWVGALPNQKAGQQYSCGFWAYCGEDLYPNLEITIRELSNRESKQLQLVHWGIKYKLKALHKDWAYYEIPFNVWFDDSHFEINVTQPRLYGKTLWLDELCLKLEKK